MGYCITDVVFRLKAAMKDDMHFATAVLPASFGDVGNALRREEFASSPAKLL